MSDEEEWEEEKAEDVFKLSRRALDGRAIVAAEDGDGWTLRDCLEAGADTSFERSKGVSALEAAAGGGSADCVERVQQSRFEKGAARCSKEAVERAMAIGGVKILSLLFGANKLDPKPLSAEELGAAEGFEAAIDRSSQEEVRIWAEAMGPDGARLRGGMSPLMLALSCGEGECADELARAGARMELSLPGEEAQAIAAMTRAGREDWAARLERERLDRELGGAGARAPKARL